MDLQTLATVLPTAISATLYTLVQSCFAWSLARRPPVNPPAVRPWVSVLKTVAGADDELRENLESFAALDYPAFELLIGIASPDDPAVPIVQSFLAAHPELSARLVWTMPPAGAVINPTVAQLIDLTRHARGSVLVVSDANVRVPRHYLGSVVRCLLRPGVGLVSSLVTGTCERTLGAALENAQLGMAVAPAVVAAQRLFGRPTTIGKSMAMRRADLDRVGGWTSVAGVLAGTTSSASAFTRSATASSCASTRSRTATYRARRSAPWSATRAGPRCGAPSFRASSGSSRCSRRSWSRSRRPPRSRCTW